jgi:hypothetical protein
MLAELELAEEAIFLIMMAYLLSKNITRSSILLHIFEECGPP